MTPTHQPTLDLAMTGFVAEQAGSVASANALILASLLARGHRAEFFTKPSFVDPRNCVNGSRGAERLSIVDCTNPFEDGLRRRLAPSGSGLWGRFFAWCDAKAYHRRLVSSMCAAEGGQLDLWLGDWARGRGIRPVVSYIQGPPGTDARSVERHERLIVDLAGRVRYIELLLYSRFRLSRGLPPFGNSDHFIVGSQWSRQLLIEQFGTHPVLTHVCPYPIDLTAFQPAAPRPCGGRLRVLWLGRFVPRKRLDLFLDGLASAIDQGVDAEAWVVGRSGFVPGFEKLLSAFPHQDRLKVWSTLPRNEVPGLLGQVDVLSQPSEEENFGSSVAEALACGVPTLVGPTNGTGDYVCDRSVTLADYETETYAAALGEFAESKRLGLLEDRRPSRLAAEQVFSVEGVTDTLESILLRAVEAVPVGAAS